MGLNVKDKSKAKQGTAVALMDKVCLRQSRGVEVQDANHIWEYCLCMIIASAQKLEL